MQGKILNYAKEDHIFFFRHPKPSLLQRPPLIQRFITFEFDLQHLMQVLQDVPIGLKSMARAVYANFQAKVGLCKEREDSVRNCFPRLGRGLC